MNLNTKSYRKKPVVIQAYELTPDLLMQLSGIKVGAVHFYADHVEVETLEGRMRGAVGSFVITGVEGEQYVCERNIFFKTYESVDEPVTLKPNYNIGIDWAKESD